MTDGKSSALWNSLVLRASKGSADTEGARRKSVHRGDLCCGDIAVSFGTRSFGTQSFGTVSDRDRPLTKPSM